MGLQESVLLKAHSPTYTQFPIGSHEVINSQPSLLKTTLYMKNVPNFPPCVFPDIPLKRSSF